MTESSEQHGGAYPTQTDGTSSDSTEEQQRPAKDRRPGAATTEPGRNIDGDDEATVYP